MLEQQRKKREVMVSLITAEHSAHHCTQEEEKTNPDLISQRLQKEFEEKLASMPEWQAALVRKKQEGGP